jgi:hypothetical protein
MRDILAWIGCYLIVGAVFFGVICSAIDKNGDKWAPPLFTIFIGSLLWPLTTIAALAYKLAEWLDRGRKN